MKKFRLGHRCDSQAEHGTHNPKRLAPKKFRSHRRRRAPPVLCGKGPVTFAPAHRLRDTVSDDVVAVLSEGLADVAMADCVQNQVQGGGSTS